MRVPVAPSTMQVHAQHTDIHVSRFHPKTANEREIIRHDGQSGKGLGEEGAWGVGGVGDS